MAVEAARASLQPAKKTTPSRKRLLVAVSHLLAFLDAVAMWMLITILPLRTTKLGASPVVYGYMKMVEAICVLLGAPIFGLFGDVFGPRAALLVSFFSAIACYTVIAMGNSIPALFLSRLFCLTKHAGQGLQLVVTDVTSVHERAGALGKLRLTGGIGMVIGPALGGYVASFTNEQFVAGLGAILSAIGTVVVMVTIPRKMKDPTRTAVAGSGGPSTAKPATVFSLEALISLLRIPVLLYVLVLRAVVLIPMEALHTVFILASAEKDVKPQNSGMMFSYFGLVMLLFQGFGVGRISRRFSDGAIVQWGLIVLSGAYLAMCFSQHMAVRALTAISTVMSTTLLGTILDSVTTKSVPHLLVGSALGLNTTVGFFIRAICPAMGAYMYTLSGYSSVGVLGFVLSGAMATIVALYGPVLL